MTQGSASPLGAPGAAKERLEPLKPAAWTTEASRRAGAAWESAGSWLADFAAHPQAVGLALKRASLPNEAE